MEKEDENKEPAYLFLKINLEQGVKFKITWTKNESDYVKKKEQIGFYTVDGSIT